MTAKDGKSSGADERRERLARELRANLQKRKAQARARAAPSENAPETGLDRSENGGPNTAD